jgi:hypothetical protein
MTLLKSVNAWSLASNPMTLDINLVGEHCSSCAAMYPGELFGCFMMCSCQDTLSLLSLLFPSP